MATQIKKKFIEGSIFEEISQEIDQKVAVEKDRAEAAEAAEESARIAADNAIKGDLSDAVHSTIEGLDDALAAEEAARSAADTTLQGNIDDEAAARILGDSNLQSAIDQEVSDRQAAVQGVQDQINALDGNYATDAEVAAAVQVEKERAEGQEAAIRSEFAAADTYLDNTLAQEIEDRTNNDTVLLNKIDTEKARIDAILDASTADKDSFAEIVTLINSVDTENDQAFASYVLSNDAALAQEVSDREADRVYLEGQINAEESARIAADSTLQANIDAEETARSAADAALQANIDAEAAARSAEDATMLKVDGSRSMEADLSMGTFGYDFLLYAQYFQVESPDQATMITDAAGIQAIESSQGFPLIGLHFNGQVVMTDVNVFTQPDGTVFLTSLPDNTFYDVFGENFQTSDYQAICAVDNTPSLTAYSIKNVADGVESGDAVNKGQMDAAVQGVQSQIDALDGNYATDAEVAAAVSAEESARIAADSTLQSNLNSVENALYSQIGDVIGDINGDEAYQTIKALTDAVEAEEAARSVADSTLQSNIDYVEGELYNHIGGLTGDEAYQSIKALTDAVEAEEAARASADSTLQGNIDTEKARIDAILDASTADKDSFAEIVTLINSVDTENDQAFASYVLSNDAAVAALQADVDQNELDGDNDRAAIRSEFAAADSALQGQINAEVSRATSAESALDGRATVLEGEMDAAEGRLDVLEGEMDAAEGRLDVLEAVAWSNEKFELAQADIDNGFISLSQSPISGSMSAFVGRLALHEGATEDYEVSGSQVTFLNDLVGTGNQKLQVGDVIYVKYQYQG